MTIREGKWRCPGCGEINRGSVQQCADCGATRDANTKFFLDDADAPPLTDAALLRKAQAGPDWVCSFCDNANPAGAPRCEGCGAEPKGKVHAHGDVVPVIAPLRAAAQEAAEPAAPSPRPHALAAATAPSGNPIGGLFKLGFYGVLGIVGLLLCCCMSLVFVSERSPQDVVGTVARVEWQRSISVESLGPVHETSWDSAPAGAYDVTHRREVRDHKQVQTGTKTVYRKEQVQVGTRTVITKERVQNGFKTVTTQERVQAGTKTVLRKERVKVGSHKVVTGHKDLGNGFFEDVTKDVADYEMRDVPHEEPNFEMRDVPHQEPNFELRDVPHMEPAYEMQDVPHEEPVYASEPVYGESYSYTIDRWSPARTPQLTGTSEPPRWPDLALGPKERESERHEAYTVWFSIPSVPQQPSLRVGADDFARYAPGTTWKLGSQASDTATVVGPATGASGGG